MKIKCPCCNTRKVKIEISYSAFRGADSTFCTCKKCGEYWFEDTRNKFYPNKKNNESNFPGGGKFGSFTSRFTRNSILGIW